MIGASHPFSRRTLNALDENGNEGCSVCGRPRDVHPEPGGEAPRFRDYLHEDEIVWPGAWRLKGEEYEVPFGEALPDGPASFTCPACGMTSHHPADAAHGYCGNCHAFTGEDGARYYTIRVDRRGWPDPDIGPDGPLTREEALARVTGPDPHSMWWTIALRVAGGGGGRAVSDDPEFAAWLQSEVLKAYGLKPWHVGLAPAPLEVRLRAAVNRSRQRKLWQQARRLRIRA